MKRKLITKKKKSQATDRRYAVTLWWLSFFLCVDAKKVYLEGIRGEANTKQDKSPKYVLLERWDVCVFQQYQPVCKYRRVP